MANWTRKNWPACSATAGGPGDGPREATGGGRSGMGKDGPSEMGKSGPIATSNHSVMNAA